MKSFEAEGQKIVGLAVVGKIWSIEEHDYESHWREY